MEWKPVLEASISKSEKWVEDQDYKACEPADALSFFLRPLTFGRLYSGRVLVQVFKQSPLNLRPVLKVKPHDTAIG